MSVLFISRQWLKSEDIQRISLLFYNKILEKEVSYFLFQNQLFFQNVGFFQFHHEIVCVFFLHVKFKWPLTITDFFLAFPVVLPCMHYLTAHISYYQVSVATLLVINKEKGKKLLACFSVGNFPRKGYKRNQNPS